jgi:hypothetical protein
MVRIPVKVNAIPVGSRTAFRHEGEHPSERSDAGLTIVQKVFDFVKWEGRIKAGRKSGAKRRKKATSGERGAVLFPASVL